ncbi:hypothetical protein D0T53_10605 [Dysgonomonas sp. 216]|nr:hypothetical protein [Dysgonomonas sp. 216]
MNVKTFAAIDIGSNAMRFLINNVETDAENVTEFKKVAYMRIPIRLGEDVFTQGFIGEDKFNRLNEAMIGISYIMKAYGVSNYMACATSAMRDAWNGEQIIEKILRSSGININIISGNDEAALVFEAGGADSASDKSKHYLFVDVGGGSTEVVLYSNGQKISSGSFLIGTVRMLAGKVTDDELNTFRGWLGNINEKYSRVSVIASGGNINKMHKLLGKKAKETLNHSDLIWLNSVMTSLSFEERMHRFKLNEYRADVIIPALKIFLTLGEVCNVEEIFVPKVGLADGIIHHLANKIS